MTQYSFQGHCRRCRPHRQHGLGQRFVTAQGSPEPRGHPVDFDIEWLLAYLNAKSFDLEQAEEGEIDPLDAVA